MNIKIYTISGAPRGWRVLIGLALKDLTYQVHYLNGSSQEHKQAAFLKINPRGRVPVMDVDGMIVRDSIAILAWLDRKHPDKPLFGINETEARKIWQITMEACDYLRDATNTFLRPILVENMDLPADHTEAMDNLQTAGKKMHNECTTLEASLEHTTFFAGDLPSAAEAIIFPEIRLLKRAIEKRPELVAACGFDHFHVRYPRLSAWSEAVEALPNVADTLPYHWNEK